MRVQETLSRRGGGRVATAFAAFLWAITADAGVLFPEPLHITREIDDPIAESTATVDEFFNGNRAIRVSGSRVSIADYDRQELTVIDRAAKTYSITPFADIAKAQVHDRRPGLSPTADAIGSAGIHLKSLGARLSAAGTPVDAYEIAAGNVVVEVSIDRRFKLSRDAAEVVLGASYPNRRTSQHDAALRASQNADHYGLPAEHSVTYRIGSESVTQRNRVTRVDRERPLDDLTSIPPGAQRQESPLILLPRLMKQLDELPSQVKPR